MKDKKRREIKLTPCEKSDDGFHNFPVAHGFCIYCKVSQDEISGIKFRGLKKLLT